MFGRGSELLPALIGWLYPASEVALYARFANAPRVAAVAPNDWMHLGQEALARRLQFEEGRHLVPLRDECGALIGRVGLAKHIVGGGTLVLHGVRCGEIRDLVGLVLARENNRDARRTEAAVAGSPAAWSKWAEQVVDGHPNQGIDTLLRLHPLLRDRDLPVWRAGVHPSRPPLKKMVQRLGFRVWRAAVAARGENGAITLMRIRGQPIRGHGVTLVDLGPRIVASNEFRVHLGEVPQGGEVDISDFDSAFELSYKLVIVPEWDPPDRGEGTDIERFPWLLGAVPIDYQSRLEAQLNRHWGGFEKHEDDDEIVGDVEGIKIRRSVTVYRRTPTACVRSAKPAS